MSAPWQMRRFTTSSCPSHEAMCRGVSFLFIPHNTHGGFQPQRSIVPSCQLTYNVGCFDVSAHRNKYLHDVNVVEINCCMQRSLFALKQNNNYKKFSSNSESSHVLRYQKPPSLHDVQEDTQQFPCVPSQKRCRELNIHLHSIHSTTRNAISSTCGILNCWKHFLHSFFGWCRTFAWPVVQSRRLVQE